MRTTPSPYRASELLEGALFVRIAQLDRAPKQFVVVGIDRGSATELGIEGAQQGVLATRRRGEVGCAVDDLVVGDEHGATVGEQPDTSRRRQPVLPMSSTPLPFQRNFTTLSSPAMPLEYRSATVSPVVAELSMPLKP